MMIVSQARCAAFSSDCRAISTGDTSFPRENTGTPTCSPSTCSWVIAAGRYTSAATSSGLFFFFFRLKASLPTVVVLPVPCRPTSMMMVGGLSATVSLAWVPPRSSVSSSSTILMICWLGLRFC